MKNKIYGSCRSCERPIRPRGSRPEDYPKGSVSAASKTLCQTCGHKLTRKRQIEQAAIKEQKYRNAKLDRQLYADIYDAQEPEHGWWDKSACIGVDTDFFYPYSYSGQDAEAVVAFCRQCPVRKDCALSAILREKGTSLGTRYGIFGLTPADRLRLEHRLVF